MFLRVIALFWGSHRTLNPNLTEDWRLPNERIRESEGAFSYGIMSRWWLYLDSRSNGCNNSSNSIMGHWCPFLYSCFNTIWKEINGCLCNWRIKGYKLMKDLSQWRGGTPISMEGMIPKARVKVSPQAMNFQASLRGRLSTYWFIYWSWLQQLNVQESHYKEYFTHHWQAGASKLISEIVCCLRDILNKWINKWI